MNRVQPPPYDDAAAFAGLSNNARVGSHPHLQPLVGTVQASYAQYVAVNGAPTLVQNPAISDALATFLKGHYADPPADLAHITKMRESSKHLVCPMCGSMHSGTLDHYLPKNGYPIFSVFSKNLIPACNCNSRRGEILFGPNPGERVLHPYFDNCLGERLVSAHFEDLGAVPKVSLVLLVSNAHANYPAIKFHVDSIVKRSAVVGYVRDRWSKLIRRPSLIVRAFAKNIATEAEVQAILAGERDCLDDLHGGKNNWDSIFLSGLLDPPVTAWIAGRFAVPGRVADSALA
ncbi:hypothetical protein SAMN05216359_1163 [Roseateles sp. YR242]|uniref:hypothetical protein n=1 Tax=Roseateles sp. YR242 TaxID=1855305 RepID=UPI0008CD531A|nr:hypothetical protein [Roseateles sp. YR242]SEL75926.1 hypothetical protein SAMN05216359_1163 [Roseateles sp. YR242]